MTCIYLAKRTTFSADMRDYEFMPLPQPADLTSLVLRVDFSDDAAWGALQMSINQPDQDPSATYISDPAYAGASIQALIDQDSRDEPYHLRYLFIADGVTMRNEEHPLLAVDLREQPGRTFRVPPRWYADVSANLALANMDFHEFADAADPSGTYRGFGD
jgi:hypothetical protein